jgi:RNA 3'-terminal phosphate cyclase (ATP)
MGSVTFKVTPLPVGTTFPAFELVERGAIARIEATVLAPRTGWGIMKEELARRVGDKFPDVEFSVQFEDSRGEKRLYLLLVAISEDGHRLGRDLLYDQKIKSIPDAAARLVKRVIDELGEEVEHGGCVDEYMRDQLVIFQALAEGRCEIDSGRGEDGKNVKPSLHTLTAHWVANQLLGVEFDQEGICDGIGLKARGETRRKGNEVEETARDLEKVDLSQGS